jgi:hypothetical protein
LGDGEGTKGTTKQQKETNQTHIRHFARWHEDKEGTTRGTREQKDQSQSRVLFFFFA